MEATKTMREMMMVAASLFAVSACGAVEPLDTAMDPVIEEAEMSSGSGAGSASGSGAGSGSNEPTGCTKASECGTDMMCDLQTHTCMTPELTISSDEFLVQGSTWWTFTSSPLLQGTYAGPPGAVVTVDVGGTSVTVAHSEGGQWSATIPEGAIQPSDTIVNVALTDPSGGALELSQRIALDGESPKISLYGTTIYDERNDSIDFSTGEPVHRHNDPKTDLSDGECPSVYKYAYLMDLDPAYGTSANANPLAFKLKIEDSQLDPMTPMFRVRSQGQFLIDWRPLSAPTSDVYTIELTRNDGANAIPLLGTRSGAYYVDVRASDRGGQQAMQTFCWDHNPLEAPVELHNFAGDELFGVSLPNDSEFAWMINASGHAPVGLAHQRIVQYTAEPTVVQWTGSIGRIDYSKTIFNDWVLELVGGTTTFCPAGNTKPECRLNWEPPHYSGLSTVSGTVLLGLSPLSVIVVDEQTGQTVASSSTLNVSFPIPARASGEAPRAYRVIMRIPHLASLGPQSVSGWGAIFDEYSLLGKTYTGDAKVSAGVSCLRYFETPWGTACEWVKQYWHYTAVDWAHVELVNLAASIKQNGTVPAYAPSASVTVDKLVWDSGDDDLPGPN